VGEALPELEHSLAHGLMADRTATSG